MHARMTVAHAQPDRVDEAVAAVQETFLELLVTPPTISTHEVTVREP